MSARQPFTPTPSRPSSRATNPDQSLPPTSARSRLTLPPAQPSSHSNGDGGQDVTNTMQPLNLTGLKANKQMRKSAGGAGAQRVPHNAANAPPQPQSAIPLRHRASLSASSTPGGGGGGGGGIVAPRPLSPYVCSASSTIGNGDMDMDLDMAFKTPALPFPPGLYVTNTTTTATTAVGAMPAATANAASAQDDTHTHISTDNHSRQRHHQPQPQRRQQNPFSHSLDSDALDPDPDDSGYASSTSHVAHISTPSTRTRKRAAYVDVDGDGEDNNMNGEGGMDGDGYGEDGDRQGKRFRYGPEPEEEGRESTSGGAEFLAQRQEQEVPSRRGSVGVGVGDRQTPGLVMRPASVVAYQRHSSHGQHLGQGQRPGSGGGQAQAQHPDHGEGGEQGQVARMSFFEAIMGLDVDLDEGEIEGYARSFEGYQARWTRDKDHDNEEENGKGLEEWDRGGDELVGKFERVIKSWKEDMVATVTSYQTISQDLDDHRALLAERAHEYQTVKESIVREQAGFKV